MEIEKFGDGFGPELIVKVHSPKVGLHGILVIDNTARGPGKGGIRMTPFVTMEEVFRLARTMTWKNALAELPWGGAKSGIIANPKKISVEEKKALIQAFSKAIKPLVPKLYIAGPDVNTGEQEMKWFAEANGSLKACTGKPEEMGGLPHELGSTGFGVAIATRIALKSKRIKLEGSRIAIQGFGNVGTFTFKFLSDWGAKIVAVSDSKGCIYNPEGLNYEELMRIKKETGSVINYKNGEVLPGEKIFGLEVDSLIPAALSDVITKENVEEVKAKIIVEGANIPVTKEAEEILHQKGILVIPDFVANAGGVISSYAEYRRYDEQKMFKLVERKIRKNTKLVLKKVRKEKIKPRDAALEIAKERVRKAMEG